ncbi:MAG: hypothetical protein HY907_18215 [Deltaproteobacteria bacterium]|nr:hypothetical protein [Deltaproteobacteria bacterium]
MTYNFDPEKWYENHRAVLEERRRRGELDDAQLARELEELDRRLEEMVQRLDGTYQLPRS